MKYAFSILPFIVSIALLSKGKKTYFSMLFSATIGILINYCLPSAYNLPHFTLNGWFDHVLLGNISTIISIYLLGLLMYVITYSKTIDCVGNWFEQHMTSHSHFLAAIPILSMLMSQDDYLSCFSSGTISGKLASRFDISKSIVAVIVNITAVTACCVSPISSWSPVIIGVLRNAGFPTQYSVISVPFNFVILFFAIYIIVLCYNTGRQNASHYNRKQNPSSKDLEETNKGLMSLCVIIATLLISYILFNKIAAIDSPLILSSIISILVALHALYKDKLISFSQICHAVKDTVVEMTSLTLSLLSIWTFAMVCNDYLGFNTFIIECYQRLHAPTLFMPAIVFILASLFSFLTGSSYGTFNLFIPLAAQLSLNQSREYQLLAIAGAIGGSLYAVFSYSSDTTALCAQSANCQATDMRKLQLPLAKHTLFWGIIGYTLLATFGMRPITYLLTILYVSVCFTLSISVKKVKITRGVNSTILTSFTSPKYSPDKQWISHKLTRLKEYAKHYWKYITSTQIFFPLRMPK